MSQNQEFRDDHLSPFWHSRGYLPHFDGPVHTQHVTVHLADSLPKSAIERIDQQIEALVDEERLLERRKRLHDWIDAGHGSCLLREPDCAQIVEGALHHFDGERYHLYAWVVMPNHFHVLFQPMEGWSMAKIVASWKKFTATEIKKWLRANAEIRDPGNATLPSCSASESVTEANAEIRYPGNATLPSCTTSESVTEANAEIRDPGNATLPSCSASESVTEANAEIRYPGNATLPSCTTSESVTEANAEIRDPGKATLPSCSASESVTEANAEIRDPGNATLPSCSASQKSPLWHPEYWDRYIRNEKHFNAVVDYIHNNPVKAGLCETPELWPFSSADQS